MILETVFCTAQKCSGLPFRTTKAAALLQVRDYVRRRRWVRTGIRSEDVGVPGSAVQQLVSMSTSPPPLLPLAELLGDSADVSVASCFTFLNVL